MVYSFMSTVIIIISLFKETNTGIPNWMNESKVVMCYPAICEQADDEDVVGDGWLSLHLFFRFMGNFMEVNTAFDWAGRAIVTQNGNAQRVALSWATNDFTHLTKDFCKRNPVLLSFNSFIY